MSYSFATRETINKLAKQLTNSRNNSKVAKEFKSRERNAVRKKNDPGSCNHRNLIVANEKKPATHHTCNMLHHGSSRLYRVGNTPKRSLGRWLPSQ